MSNPYLPAELLDHIVDLLHDAIPTLRNCCLVSKSWIPHTRKHLFAKIRFHTEKDLQLWKEAFPNPSTSPANYASTLYVGCPHVVTAVDAEPGSWITSFSHVLVMIGIGNKPPSHKRTVDFVPFHEFSLFTKSLHLRFAYISSSQIFDLIHSFPLLEDLTVVAHTSVATHKGDGSDGLSAVVQPPSIPILTGSLELFVHEGMKPIASRLLSLLGGIHFQKLTLRWCHEKYISLITALVKKCSHTLKSLDINYKPQGASIRIRVYTDKLILFPVGSTSTPVDLSDATRLKDVSFWVRSRNVDWITAALRTITPEHRDLRQISIYVCYTDVGTNKRFTRSG